MKSFLYETFLDFARKSKETLKLKKYKDNKKCFYAQWEDEAHIYLYYFNQSKKTLSETVFFDDPDDYVQILPPFDDEDEVQFEVGPNQDELVLVWKRFFADGEMPEVEREWDFNWF